MPIPTMSLSRRSLLRLSACAWPARATPSQAAAPALMLANLYRPGIELARFWVSEKYDGLRGYWDGRRLLLRGGGTVATPAWFTAHWPTTPMDGELWAGRGRFHQATSTVRRSQPVDDGWRGLRFMVFDLPTKTGSFDERLQSLRAGWSSPAAPWLVAVQQRRVSSHAALLGWMRQIVAQGGEGLMLHRADAPYRAGRGDDLLKLKPHLDAQARVLAHLPGNGRHAGRLGALLVQTPEGRQFRLGTGFNDTERARPPAPGTWVVYQFQELTPGGLPRFARFLRVADDATAADGSSTTESRQTRTMPP